MQVTSTTNYPTLMLQKASSTAFSPTTNTPATSSSTSGVGTFDFTDMTPNQMKSAVQTLAARGQITGLQAMKMQLAGIPLGTLVNGQFEPLTAAQQESFANAPVNYMQLFQSNMTFLQQNGMASDPKSGYADDQAILSAMQSAQGGISSVNITA
jgi:hypothetical protein